MLMAGRRRISCANRGDAAGTVPDGPPSYTGDFAANPASKYALPQIMYEAPAKTAGSPNIICFAASPLFAPPILPLPSISH